MTDYIRDAADAVRSHDGAAVTASEGGFGVADLLVAIGEGKKILVVTIVVSVLCGVLLAIVLPPSFQAKTVLLPPQDSRASAASALAGIGALAGAAGGALGVKSPDELYIGLLQSDSVQNGLILRFGLRSRYHAKTMQDARLELTRRSLITSDKKSGLLTVVVTDPEAKTAAEIANGYAEELSKLLGRIAVTDAQQRRRFLETEVKKSRAALVDAQDQYTTLQAKTGIVSIDADTQLAIRRASEIRSELAARQIELESMRTYATAENPQLQIVVAGISELQNQLTKIEHGDASRTDNSDAAVATIRSYREMKYQEATTDLLSRELESARIDEARDGPLVQQVDVATPPEKRAKPGRSMIVLLSAVVGLIVGLLFVFGRYGVRGLKTNPEASEQLARIRSAWTSNRP